MPETLMHALAQLDEAYHAAKRDPEFQGRLTTYLEQYAGRPTPLYFAERLTAHCGGPRIYIKRDPHEEERS